MLKNNYKDLYDFGVIQLKNNPTFEVIKNYFKPMETVEKTFKFKNNTIVAKRKFTYKGAGCKMFQIKTNYLHIWITVKNGSTYHYKEQKDKSFKQS